MVYFWFCVLCSVTLCVKTCTHLSDQLRWAYLVYLISFCFILFYCFFKIYCISHSWLTNWVDFHIQNCTVICTSNSTKPMPSCGTHLCFHQLIVGHWSLQMLNKCHSVSLNGHQLTQTHKTHSVSLYQQPRTKQHKTSPWRQKCIAAISQCGTF